jgi:hypothetical protein
LVTKGKLKNDDSNNKTKFNLQIWDISNNTNDLMAPCLATFPLPSRALASNVALR